MVYLALALAAMVALAAAGYEGFTLGGDHERAERAEQDRKDKEIADFTRQANQAAARKSAAKLETAQAANRKLSRDNASILEAHLGQMPAGTADCRVTDIVRDDINAVLANRAASPTGGSLPVGSGTAPAADGPKPSGTSP